MTTEVPAQPTTTAEGLTCWPFSPNDSLAVQTWPLASWKIRRGSEGRPDTALLPAFQLNALLLMTLGVTDVTDVTVDYSHTLFAQLRKIRAGSHM